MSSSYSGLELNDENIRQNGRHINPVMRASHLRYPSVYFPLFSDTELDSTSSDVFLPTLISRSIQTKPYSLKSSELFDQLSIYKKKWKRHFIWFYLSYKLIDQFRVNYFNSVHQIFILKFRDHYIRIWKKFFKSLKKVNHQRNMLNEMINLSRIRRKNKCFAKWRERAFLTKERIRNKWIFMTKKYIHSVRFRQIVIDCKKSAIQTKWIYLAGNLVDHYRDFVLCRRAVTAAKFYHLSKRLVVQNNIYHILLSYKWHQITQNVLLKNRIVSLRSQCFRRHAQIFWRTLTKNYLLKEMISTLQKDCITYRLAQSWCYFSDKLLKKRIIRKYKYIIIQKKYFGIIKQKYSANKFIRESFEDAIRGYTTSYRLKAHENYVKMYYFSMWNTKFLFYTNRKLQFPKLEKIYEIPTSDLEPYGNLIKRIDSISFLILEHYYRKPVILRRRHMSFGFPMILHLFDVDISKYMKMKTFTKQKIPYRMNMMKQCNISEVHKIEMSFDSFVLDNLKSKNQNIQFFSAFKEKELEPFPHFEDPFITLMPLVHDCIRNRFITPIKNYTEEIPIPTINKVFIDSGFQKLYDS